MEKLDGKDEGIKISQNNQNLEIENQIQSIVERPREESIETSISRFNDGLLNTERK